MPDLYKLLEKGEPIYITNHTEGTLLLEFQQEGNKKGRFEARVPPVTDHPMRLDAIVPYSILKFDHAVLHNWLQKEALRLHDPAEVKAHYEEDPELEPAVQDVLANANRSRKFAVKDIGLKVANGAMEQAKNKAGKVAGLGRMGSRSPRRVAGTDDVEVDAVPISPKITAAVNSLKEDAGLQQEMLSKMRIMDKATLTEPALWFIVSECKDFPSILKWAKNVLAKEHGNASE